MLQVPANPARNRGNTRAPTVRVVGFGKHPGWADHISGVGEATPALADLRRVLYLEGISTTLGAWEEIPPEARVDFDHWVWVLFPDRLVMARILSSVDRVGRDDFPFIVAADVEGGSLDALVSQIMAPFEVFARRCRELPTADAVRAAFATEQGVIEHRMGAAMEGDGSIYELSPAMRQAFCEQPAFDAGGLALARVMYRVESSWQPYAPIRGGRAPRSKGPGVVHRLPSLAGEPGLSLRMWQEFVNQSVHADVPRLYAFPANLPWVDLVVGNPDGAHFMGLRCDRTRVIPESEIPYERHDERLAAALKVRACGLLVQWKNGWRVEEQVSPGASGEQAQTGPGPDPAKQPSSPTLPSPPEPAAKAMEKPSPDAVGVADTAPAEPAKSALPARVTPEDSTPPARTGPVPASVSLQAPSAIAGLGPQPAATPAEPSPAAQRLAALEAGGTSAVSRREPAKPVPAAGSPSAVARTDPIPGPAPKPQQPERREPSSPAQRRSAPGTKLPQWALAAAAVVLVGGLGVWLALRPRGGDLKHRAQQAAESAWTKRDFPAALLAIRQWAELDPTNQVPKQRLAQLEGGLEIVLPGPREVAGGAQLPLAPQVRDALARPVSVVATAEALKEGDRLDRSAEGWVLVAGIGAAREARIRFTATNGMSAVSTTVVVQVTADPGTVLLAQADRAYDNRQYADALRDYRAFAAIRSDTRVDERIKRLTEPPKVTVPGPLQVVEGQSLQIALTVSDSLDRPVSIRVRDEATVGRSGTLKAAAGSGGRIWTFMPAPGARSPVVLGFLASNEAQTAPFEVNVQVMEDPALGVRRAADRALTAGQWYAALTNYEALLKLKPADPEAREVVSLLRQPPALGVEGPTNAIAGRTVNGWLSVKSRPAVRWPISWEVEVDSSGLGAGQFTLEKSSNERRAWTWKTPADVQTNGLVRFRAWGPTATSEWRQLTLAVRLPPPLTIDGLPATLALTEGNTNGTTVTFRTRSTAGEKPAARAWLRSAAGAPEVVLRENAPGDWTATIGAARRAGHYTLLLAVVHGDTAVTNSVELIVAAARPPAVEISEEAYLWVPTAKGGAWPGKPGPGYWVSRTEVSRAEYEQTMGGRPANAKEAGPADFPVVNVTGEEARKYCEAKTAQQAATLNGWRFDLPTLQQWREYSVGGEIPPGAVLNRAPIRGVREGSANSKGVWHTVGNVYELCRLAGSDGVKLVGLSFDDVININLPIADDLLFFDRPFDMAWPHVGFRVVVHPP